MSAERLSAITGAFEQAAGQIKALEARLKFDLGKVGKIFLDGTVSPCKVSNADEAADCVVEIDLETLESIMAGQIDSRAAFTQGKMCLIGDMSVAVKLVALMNTAVA